MIDPSVLRALQANGATVDMIIAAVEADALAERERLNLRRSKDAQRQRKSRASRRVTVTPSDNADMVPNDIYSNPPDPSLSKDKPSPLPERVVEAWNGKAGKAGARDARGCPASRKRLVKLREAEHGEAAIFEMIANVAASAFHCGKGDRGWRANLDWALEPKNFQKMLELTPAPSAKPMALVTRTAEQEAAYQDYLSGKIDQATYFKTAAKAQPPPTPRQGRVVAIDQLVKQFAAG